MRKVLSDTANGKNPFVIKGLVILALFFVFTLNATAQTNYYLKAGQPVTTLASWGTATNGSGTPPGSFTANNRIFNITNNAVVTLTAAWAVTGTGSKVVVGDGVTACNFTIPSGFALSAASKIDVTAGSTLILNNTTVPDITTCDVASTVEYAGSGAQAVNTATYGNLIISGSNTTSFATSMTVAGDLTLNIAGTFLITSGITLTINGDFIGTSGLYNWSTATNGASTISLKGNFYNTGVVFNGTGTSSDGTIIFSGTGTVANPQIFSNTTSSNITNTGYTINSTTAVQLNATLPLDRVDATTLTVSGILNMQGFTVSAVGASGNAVTSIASGGTLMINNALGIPGAIPATGNTRTFSSAANYEFDGSGVTGVFTTSPTATTVKGLTISNGATVAASQVFTATTLTVNAGSTFNATTLTATTGTVTASSTLNTSGALTASTSLTVSATSTVTASAAFTIGSLVITSGSLLTAGAASSATALNIDGTLHMGIYRLTGATGTLAGAGTIETQCTTATSTTPIPASKTWTGTILYDSPGTTQTVVLGTYNNLTINTTATHTTGGALTVNGVLDITGTLNMGITNRLVTVGTTNGTGTLQTQVPTLTSAAPIPAGETWTFEVVYNAATAQTVMQGTYNGGITFSAAGVKKFTAGTNDIGGDWSSAGGQVDVTTNVVVTNFTGASAQAIADAGSNGGLGVVFGTVNFSGGGVKTLSTSSSTVPWSVKTNWTSTGGKIDLVTNSVTLIFTGTTTQAISDAGSDGGNGVKFFNVQFSGGTTGTKTLSAGNFSVANTGTITMATNTKLDANGNLVLDSDASGSATVAQMASGASIIGNVNVKRFFTGGDVTTQRGYRLVSSPVNTNGITDNTTPTSYFTLSGTTDLYTGGPGGSTSGFTVTNSGTPTVFLFREDTPPIITSFNYGNYKGISTLNTTPFNVASLGGTFTLYTGNGIMFYYVGSISSNTTFNTKTGSPLAYPDPDDTKASFIGTLNQGTIPVRLWYNGNTSFAYTGGNGSSGFYLVGNPYASTIDLNKFSVVGTTDPGTAGIWGGSKMTNIIYIYDYANKQFTGWIPGTGKTNPLYNASQYVASGQGFFVKATSASGAQLNFHESAKTTASNNPTGSNLLMGAPVTADARQFLYLRVTQNTIKNDVLVLFGPDTKDTFEEASDFEYLPGVGSTIAINTFAKGSNMPLIANQMHSIDSLTRVRINIGSTLSGTDTLSGTGFEKLDSRYPAYLVDHYKNDLSLPFTSATKYAFNINLADTSSYGANRFELVFRKSETLTKYKLLSFTAAKFNNSSSLKLANSGIVLTWKVENEGKFTGFTIQRADGSLQFLPIYSLQSDGSGTYTYTDHTPLTGVNKYRLMQNGAYENISYSDTVSINLGGAQAGNANENQIKIFPNPVINQLRIDIGDNPPNMIHVTVMNSGGRVMISKDVGGNNIEQNVSKLFPGIYVVEISNVDTKRVIGRKKFIKL